MAFACFLNQRAKSSIYWINIMRILLGVLRVLFNLCLQLRRSLGRLIDLLILLKVFVFLGSQLRVSFCCVGCVGFVLRLVFLRLFGKLCIVDLFFIEMQFLKCMNLHLQFVNLSFQGLNNILLFVIWFAQIPLVLLFRLLIKNYGQCNSQNKI